MTQDIPEALAKSTDATVLKRKPRRAHTNTPPGFRLVADERLDYCVSNR
jgi:hypothetical protein